jgi:predicted RNase H-like HicB family nuclease
MNSPGDVPVFNCVVHVAPVPAEGSFVARVVNLAGIESRGESEREALSKCVASFKAAVASHLADGTPIPWIEPPPHPAAGEIQRLIAVHL